MQTPYPVVTSNYVPGLRLEFARFYGETGHFKLNFSVENSNFSQFFISGIHIHTFSHNFAEKKFRFIGTLSVMAIALIKKLRKFKLTRGLTQNDNIYHLHHFLTCEKDTFSMNDALRALFRFLENKVVVILSVQASHTISVAKSFFSSFSAPNLCNAVHFYCPSSPVLIKWFTCTAYPCFF